MQTSDTSTTVPDTTTADPRPLLGRALATAQRVVDDVGPDQLHLPTPCTGFDVEQLLGHIAFALTRVAAAGRGTDVGLHDLAVTSTDWSRDIASLGAAALDAWADDARLTAPIELPWTTITGAETIAVYVNELTVHTWDLATATGRDVDWDDAVVTLSHRAIEQQLPMADRDPMWQAFVSGLPEGTPFSAPFANAQPVGADAAPIERLVAWNGRVLPG